VANLPTIHSGEYEDRILVFIDILGFGRDIMSLSENPALILSIEAVLSKLGKCKFDLDRKRVSKGVEHDARMTCFSDCVALSYKAMNGAALHAMSGAAFIGQMLMSGGYLPRGVITLGKLVHTDQIVFGEALVCAAAEEKQNVVMPKMKVDNCIFELLADEDKQAFVKDRGDGRFVHILSDQWSWLAEERQNDQANDIAVDRVAEMYDEMRSALTIRYERAPDERARQKLRWVRDYINSTIDEQSLPSSNKISLPDN
jgi:hypothetical protein